MRKLTAIILVLTLALWCGQAFAAEQKGRIGYVNLQRALNDSVYGAKIKSQLEAMIQEKQGDIDAKVQQKVKMEKELEKQASLLSDEAVRKRMDEVEKFEKEIERMVSDYENDMKKTQREKEMEILKDLNDIVIELAKEDGLELVLPSEVVIYGVEQANITDKVIVRYNKMKAAQDAAPKDVAPDKKTDPKGGK